MEIDQQLKNIDDNQLKEADMVIDDENNLVDTEIQEVDGLIVDIYEEENLVATTGTTTAAATEQATTTTNAAEQGATTAAANKEETRTT
nr:hypothetical protein [Tanacetum cinerariifolium]